MLRFGTKSMLIAFAVVALWMATLTDYPAANEFREGIFLVIFFAAGFAAFSYRGKQRAFWIGFFSVMLLLGGDSNWWPIQHYVPDVTSAARAWTNAMFQLIPLPTTFNAAFVTMRAIMVLSLSVLVGLIGAQIWEQSRKSDSK